MISRRSLVLLAATACLIPWVWLRSASDSVALEPVVPLRNFERSVEASLRGNSPTSRREPSRDYPGLQRLQEESREIRARIEGLSLSIQAGHAIALESSVEWVALSMGARDTDALIALLMEPSLELPETVTAAAVLVRLQRRLGIHKEVPPVALSRLRRAFGAGAEYQNGALDWGICTQYAAWGTSADLAFLMREAELAPTPRRYLDALAWSSSGEAGQFLAEFDPRAADAFFVRWLQEHASALDGITQDALIETLVERASAGDPGGLGLTGTIPDSSTAVVRLLLLGRESCERALSRMLSKDAPRPAGLSSLIHQVARRWPCSDVLQVVENSGDEENRDVLRSARVLGSSGVMMHIRESQGGRVRDVVNEERGVRDRRRAVARLAQSSERRRWAFLTMISSYERVAPQVFAMTVAADMGTSHAAELLDDAARRTRFQVCSELALKHLERVSSLQDGVAVRQLERPPGDDR